MTANYEIINWITSDEMPSELTEEHLARVVDICGYELVKCLNDVDYEYAVVDYQYKHD